MEREFNLAKLALDLADVVIVALDRDGTVVEINRKGCEVLGYSKDEVVGRNWFDHFLPQEGLGEVKALFGKLMEGAISLERYENPVLTRDGSRRMISWHNLILKNEEGKVDGTLSSGQDVTRRAELAEETERYRQRLEEALAERTVAFAQADRKLSLEVAQHRQADQGLTLRAAIMDSAREAILVLNPRGDLAYANDAAARAYGYTCEELLEMNLTGLLRPRDAAAVEARLKQVLREGQIDVEAIHVRKDGSLMPVEVRHSLIRWSERDAARVTRGRFVVSVVRDISREFRQRSLLRSIPCVLLATDVDLRLTESQGAGLGPLGLKAGERLGVPLARYLDETGFGEEAWLAHRQALAGPPVAYRVDNSRTQRRYHGWAGPLRSPEGEISGAISVIVEAAERLAEQPAARPQ